MKQSLQLKLNQQLSMTPQLQQAIRLLQLSTLELQQEIQLALESNPLLELDEQFDEINVNEPIDVENLDSRDALEQQTLSDDTPLDTTWDELYTAGTPSGTSSDYQVDEQPIYQGETTQNLQDYLMWQVNLTPFTDIDRTIATAIVEAVSESGYLTVPLEDILNAVNDPEVTLEEIEIVLKRIQHFDPIGVAARNLRECLLIQLNQLDPATPLLNETRLIIDGYLDLLGDRDFRSLIKQSKLKEETLKEVVQLITSLDPRPGQSISSSESDYIVPDVFVHKDGEKWQVDLNKGNLPQIKINQRYASLTNLQDNNDNQFIRNNLQEAKWLIKSLESRNETLLKVSQSIFEQQQGFFEFGEEQMKPMILADIAQILDMHESTISRVTTQKYLHCPRGIYELKYFFSSHVNTDVGGEASSTAIRALVKKLISTENVKKPLSDSKIVTLLAEQGIIVARRTVAKYRESLSIPPSNLRKQLV